MNILLIYPEFPDTFWSFRYALGFIGKKANSPPLGLLTVAAMLPPQWNKRLVDVNVTPLTEADLAWADLALISGMIVQQESAQQIITRCKESGLTVVAGGPLFTVDHERFPEVDHFVLNEAELTLPAFLADLEQGQAKHMYASSDFADLEDTPVPLWELADLSRYAEIDIQFSRGCPFNCDFCSVTALLGHRPRTKTARQIIAELDQIYALGWRASVFFVDDNLIGNKKVLKSELLPAIIEWQKNKIGISFSTEASINLADDEQLIELMVRAGFVAVFIGIETPDEDSLAECSKKQNLNRDLIADVKRMQRAGLQVRGGFIVGFDSDTPSIFQRQIDFIQNSGIVTAMVGLLQALPGTRLHERLKREGRLLEELSGDNVDGTTNIVSKMDPDTLYKGYTRIMQHIYSPKHYHERIKTLLREYKPPKIRAPFDLEYLLAFFRSIYHLGIVDKTRVHYWKLFIWSLFHRPALFPLAITLMIYGAHFRRICEM